MMPRLLRGMSPGRKIYPAECPACLGKGRIKTLLPRQPQRKLESRKAAPVSEPYREVDCRRDPRPHRAGEARPPDTH
jgi:hypothetical protein